MLYLSPVVNALEVEISGYRRYSLAIEPKPNEVYLDDTKDVKQICEHAQTNRHNENNNKIAVEFKGHSTFGIQ